MQLSVWGTAPVRDVSLNKMKSCAEGEWDVVVVGAGAAGLAAAARCLARGRTVVCLEANPQRAGGRARSEQWDGAVVELGAELLHGSSICTRELAERFGHPVDSLARFAHLRYGAERSNGARMYAALERLREEAELQPGSLLDYLVQAGVVTSPADREEADILLAQTWCCAVERLAAADVQQELQGDCSGSHELEGRLPRGFSALLEEMARGVSVQLGARVTSLREEPVAEGTGSGTRLVARTADGCAFVAQRAAVVAVAAPLLQTIDFGAAIDDRLELVRRWVRMEPATKLVYQLEQCPWDADTTYLAAPQLFCRWWVGRPSDRLLVCYVTAGRAAEVDAMPEAEALREGLAQVAPLLGVDPRQLRAVRAVRQSWAREAGVGGGYCSVLPGAPHDIRQRLFEPCGRLFFAGEHTAFFSNPQTVHGAIDSGTRAADLLCQGTQATI